MVRRNSVLVTHASERVNRIMIKKDNINLSCSCEVRKMKYKTATEFEAMTSSKVQSN